MGKTIKLHSPELSENSKFHNLVIEDLSTDPTLTDVKNVGRIWFNTTDKVFKGAYLDEAGTGLTIKQLGLDLSQELETLQTELDDTQAGAGLETDGAYTADSATNYLTSATSLKDADKTLDTQIKANTDEITTLSTAVTGLQTELDDTQAGAGLETNGDYSADSSSNYLTSATSLKDADKKLDSELKIVSDDLQTEITDRSTADTNLQDNIDDLSNNLTTNYLNKTTTDPQSVAADTTFGSNVIIQGDLTVSGSQTVIEAETLKIADNIITLNDGIGTSTEPTENAGIEVDRGTEGLQTILRWNETSDTVEFWDGTDMSSIASESYVDTAVSSSESNLQTEIDNTQTGAGLETDGSYSPNTSATHISSATSLKDADTKLDSAIVQEKTERQTADNGLTTRLDDLNTASGLSDDSYAADTLTNYISDATSLFSADKKLDTQIKTNATDISNLDTRVSTNETDISDLSTDTSGLQTEIDSTQTGAGLSSDGSFTTPSGTNYLDSSTDIRNMSLVLDNELGVESDRATQKENDLQTELDDTQSGAGLGTDGAYTADSATNYLTSATSLKDADKKLDTQLKTTIDNFADTNSGQGTALIGYSGYTEADSNIVDPTIELVAGDLETVISSMSSSINTRIHEIENRYVKGEVAEVDKSDTYTISHNLETEFVDVSVQVYDSAEDVWRFDLTIVEVIDLNTVKISLSSGTSARIRYVVQGY